VGQEHITVTLKNEVAAARPSHAYLFCGTRGTGKTSCSKILAKAVNCEDPQEGDPCGVCETCKGIDEGSVLDVTEIDAASNSGVDNIRNLREEAGFTPVAAKYRVYIIDETHMLSAGAFNALLKIMEEPPAHVLFILATTEIHKVPATILSRCQRFDFKRISSNVIAERLKHIAKEENVGLEDDAAALIARLSDGGMRDALSLLDLCLTGSEAVTVPAVMERAGLVGRGHLFQFARAAFDKDGGEALRLLEGLWEKSVDYQRLCEQLIGFYRDLMVAKAVPKPEDLISCLPDELTEFKAMAKAAALEDILAALNILQDSLARMSRSSQRRTELEMGLRRLCASQAAKGKGPAELLAARVDKLEKAVRELPETLPAGKPAPKPDPAPTAEEISKTPVQAFEQWPEVLEFLRDKHAALYGSLVGSKAYTGGELLLVDSGNSVFANMVRKDSYAKESLRDAVIQVTGKKYRLGPYNPEKHEVKADTGPDLENILQQAADSGVDVIINN
jgi:DNA polymerase-3 subunit gamma/tau